MRRRFLYGSGIVLLAILATLVLWQVSFNEFEQSPESLGQTFIFWALSTLVFLLTITLGFILFRTGVKLYISSRQNREGSRIESRLYFGAFFLSFMPVCFLVVFSSGVLNRQVGKWFFRPGENIRVNYVEVAKALGRQLDEKLQIQAAMLAEHPDSVDRFCREQGVAAAQITSAAGGQTIGSCGDPAAFDSAGKEMVVASRKIREGAPDAAV